MRGYYYFFLSIYIPYITLTGVYGYYQESSDDDSALVSLNDAELNEKVALIPYRIFTSNLINDLRIYWDMAAAVSRILRGMETDDDKGDILGLSLNPRHRDHSFTGRLKNFLSNADNMMKKICDAERKERTGGDGFFQKKNSKPLPIKSITGVTYNEFGERIVTSIKLDEVEDDAKKDDIKLYIMDGVAWQSLGEEQRPRFDMIQNDEDEPGILPHMSVDTKTCKVTFDFTAAIEAGDLMDPRLFYFVGHKQMDAADHFAIYLRPIDNDAIITFADRYSRKSAGAHRAKNTTDDPYQVTQRFEIHPDCVYDPSFKSNMLTVLIEGDTRRVKLITLQLSKVPEDKWIEIKHIDREDMGVEFRRCAMRRNPLKYMNDEEYEKFVKAQEEKKKKREENKLFKNRMKKRIKYEIMDKAQWLPAAKKFQEDALDDIEKSKERKKKEDEKKFKVTLEEKWDWDSCLGQVVIFNDQVGGKVHFEVNPRQRLMRIAGASVAKLTHNLHEEEIEELEKSGEIQVKGVDGKMRANYDITNTRYTKVPIECAFYQTQGDNWRQSSEEPYKTDSYLAVVSMEETGKHNPLSPHWYNAPTAYLEAWVDTEGKQTVVEAKTNFSLDDILEKKEAEWELMTLKEQSERKENMVEVPAEYKALIENARKEALQKISGTEEKRGIVSEESVSWDDDCTVTLRIDEARRLQRLESVVIPDPIRTIVISGSKYDDRVKIKYYERKKNWKTGVSTYIKHQETFYPLSYCMPFDPESHRPGVFVLHNEPGSDQVDSIDIKFYFKPRPVQLPRVMPTEIITPLSCLQRVHKNNNEWQWQACTGVIMIDYEPTVTIALAAPFTVSTKDDDSGIVSDIPEECSYDRETSCFSIRKQAQKNIVTVKLQRKPYAKAESTFNLLKVDVLPS